MTHKTTVLFVDDEPTIRRIAELIESEDIHVITAEDGLDAYKKCIEHSPDIIFSDSILPKYDGSELCQLVKTNPATKDTPFVLLTNTDQQQLPSHFSKATIDDTLQKPFSATDLGFKIKAWTNTDAIKQSNIAKPPVFNHYKLGNASLDQQFPDGILAQSFIMQIRTHHITPFLLSNQFIHQAIASNGRCLTVSFEPPQHAFNSKLTKDPTVHTVLDASSWCRPTDLPWRNLDFIFDAMHKHCESTKVSHILMESFSLGFPFWDITDILQFVQLCRQLQHRPCILFSISHLSCLSTHIETITQPMDIVIETTHQNNKTIHSVTQSKWQATL